MARRNPLIMIDDPRPSEQDREQTIAHLKAAYVMTVSGARSSTAESSWC